MADFEILEKDFSFPKAVKHTTLPDDRDNWEPCLNCNATGLINAGFKYRKTCQSCQGMKYLNPERED